MMVGSAWFLLSRLVSHDGVHHRNPIMSTISPIRIIGDGVVEVETMVRDNATFKSKFRNKRRGALEGDLLRDFVW